MPAIPKDDAEQLLRQLLGRENEIRKDAVESHTGTMDKFIERGKFVYAILFFVITTTITVAVWVSNISREVTLNGNNIDLHDTRINAVSDRVTDMHEDTVSLHNLVATNRQERLTSLDTMQHSIDRQQALWDKYSDEIREMISMKNFGISNKERYLQTNHQPAPVLPEK